jgi:hypothetical protein
MHELVARRLIYDINNRLIFRSLGRFYFDGTVFFFMNYFAETKKRNTFVDVKMMASSKDCLPNR